MDESLMGLAELPGGGHDASHLHAQGEVFSETIGDALRDGRPARRRLLLEPSIVTRSQVAVDLASQVRHGSSAASVMPRVLAPEARPACRSVPRLRGLIARSLAPAASGARPRDASRGPDGPGHHRRSDDGDRLAVLSSIAASVRSTAGSGTGFRPWTTGHFSASGATSRTQACPGLGRDAPTGKRAVEVKSNATPGPGLTPTRESESDGQRDQHSGLSLADRRR